MIEQSGLFVPVPSAEPTVRDLRQRYDPSAKCDVPAHITILVPFLDPAALDDARLAEIRKLFAAQTEFAFKLKRPARFPQTLYLAPDPAEPFVELIRAVRDRYPGYPPYGDPDLEIVPHLTVAHGVEDRVLDAIGMAVRMNLPVEACAREVMLMAGPVANGLCAGPWREIERFPFGGPPTRG